MTAICRGCGKAAYYSGLALCRPCYDRQPERMARRRWEKMIKRCTDPTSADWKWYGARGIKVCDRWLSSFSSYYEDLGDPPPGTSLDRIDNDGDYEPGNVRWATAKQQANNLRNPQLARTACPHGHPYDDENTYVTPTGRRDCRTCRREAGRRSRQRRKWVAA